MKLSEISKDEFKQRLVDPVKAQFLERFQNYKAEAEAKGYKVELQDYDPLTIYNTHIGEGFLPIGVIGGNLTVLAKKHMFEPEFMEKNEISYTQGSDGAIKIAWQVTFPEESNVITRSDKELRAPRPSTK